MVQSHDRRDAELVAGLQHVAVMRQYGLREEALLRLDPRPLDGEAIGVEAQLAQELYILAVEPIVVAGVAARLYEPATGRMLHYPEIAVDVVALDLMRRGRRAPQETIRKTRHC